MSGSEGGSGKRTGGNAGTAPRLDPTGRRRGGHARAGAGSPAAGPLVEQLDSVRMAGLMRGQPAAHPGRDRRAAQLAAGRAG